MGREENLKAACESALKAARGGEIVTFGITPTRAETGYGYIHCAAPLDENGVCKIEGFHEKPDRDIAAAYWAAGTYLWNSGMFLFSVKTVLKAFARHAPDILAAVRKAMEKGSRLMPDRALYESVEAFSFDKAVMEKTDCASVVPCDPEWSDIGGWDSLWELGKKDEAGNAVKGRVVCHETKNCLVLGDGKRLVACAGLENLVVVETEDSLLVADRANPDALIALVDRLKREGAAEFYNLPPAGGSSAETGHLENAGDSENRVKKLFGT
jgi:mannose-1-phosphate guanylyltransferase/mannose-6-phosphate isomerase